MSTPEGLPLEGKTREQKEMALVDALNKATPTSKGFFLYHLSQYALGAGKIRDLIMKMDAEDFESFYADEIDNLKCGLNQAPNSQGEQKP